MLITQKSSMQNVCVCVCTCECMCGCVYLHGCACVVVSSWCIKTVSNSKPSEKKKLPRLFNVFLFFFFFVISKKKYIYIIYTCSYMWKDWFALIWRYGHLLKWLSQAFCYCCCCWKMNMMVKINLGNVVRVHLPFLSFIQPREILL